MCAEVTSICGKPAKAGANRTGLIFIWDMNFAVLLQTLATVIFRLVTVLSFGRICIAVSVICAGQEQLCREVDGTNYIGFVCNGAYADKYVGKASNAYKLPDSVTDIVAGLIDPLMVAYHAIHQEQLQHAFERLISKTDPVLKIVIKP